jgi:hypothetical protein
MGDIDTDTLYHRLMEQFQWGRMNEEDVQLDFYTIRTLSVIRFRSIYTRLALQLMEEGDSKRAVEVLDYLMDLAPSRVLPFDRDISGITIPGRDGEAIHHEGIIEAYYLCGEFEKGNEILLEHYSTLSSELQYFNAMNARHRSSIQREISERMFQLEELKNLLQVFGQDDLRLKLGISDFGS